jgi:hypothetical protein
MDMNGDFSPSTLMIFIPTKRVIPSLKDLDRITEFEKGKEESNDFVEWQC